jgi:hypothetical protein
MNAKRGYYSLVQFCPNPSRAEVVNFGVVLYCPDADFMAAKIAAGNKVATKLVERQNIDQAALNAAKRALERRLEVERASFQSPEDFQRFAETRANVLKLTTPRPVKVFEPEEELARLFEELVGGHARRQKTKQGLPALDEVFRRLERQGRARLDLNVTVPLLGRRLHVPYAYQNGTLNLVLPQTFANQEASAVNVAMRLAMEGDLLHRHVEDELGQKQLVVIPTFQPSDNGRQLKDRVAKILCDYPIRIISESQMDTFVAQVEREAHASSPST